MNVLGRQPETWDTGGFGCLIPREDWEEFLQCHEIITPWVTGNHWLFSMKRAVSTIKSFWISLLYVFLFPFPPALLCNLCMLSLSPFHSPSVSFAHSLRFGSWVDAYTCAMKAKLIPLFQYDTHTRQSLCPQTSKQSLWKDAVWVEALSSEGWWTLKANCQRGKSVPSS